jgi:beta-galactosidase
MSDAATSATGGSAEARGLSVVGDQFFLDGKPFRMVGGSMHYARIPRACWKDRLEKLADLGCNTLETYVFWNAHKPYPDQSVFTGDLDLRAFVELAGEMGFAVIVRPGPYSCAEWDMGGLPWWLLNTPGIKLRCSNAAFLKHVDEWFGELLPIIEPLTAARGGPVVGLQIENEYGYYGNDAAYLGHLRDLIRRHGIGEFLFTSDGAWQEITLRNGRVDGAFATANFGSEPKERFEMLRRVQKTGPLVCMEFWSGWFDTWGTPKHITRDAADYAKQLDGILSADGSVLFYMFHGGPSFGLTAGGNNSEQFEPYVTSYDYDALLDEMGDVTTKYRLCRDVVHQHMKLTQAKKEFAPSAKRAYGQVKMTGFTPLLETMERLAAPVRSAAPMTMEELGHGRGIVLYRTTLPAHYRGQNLVIRGMHDWCQVFFDGKPVCTWYRKDPQPKITLDFEGDALRLEIVVHNLSRSNFGFSMAERKGITHGVFVGPKLHEERAIFGWDHFSLPLHSEPSIGETAAAMGTGPGVYSGEFEVDEVADTFLALPGFDLGCVFINGFNVGRYWSIGPQQTLAVHAPLLRTGRNTITIVEFGRPSAGAVARLEAVHRLSPGV